MGTWDGAASLALLQGPNGPSWCLQEHPVSAAPCMTDRLSPASLSPGKTGTGHRKQVPSGCGGPGDPRSSEQTEGSAPEPPVLGGKRPRQEPWACDY